MPPATDSLSVLPGAESRFPENHGENSTPGIRNVNRLGRGARDMLRGSTIEWGPFEKSACAKMKLGWQEKMPNGRELQWLEQEAQLQREQLLKERAVAGQAKKLKVVAILACAGLVFAIVFGIWALLAQNEVVVQRNMALEYEQRARDLQAEAEPLMRRALSIDEESYGPEHPNVAMRPQQPRPIIA